jgi:hypothetical protein
MTVREAIAELQQEDPDRVLVLQKDPEGNGYSPLLEFWTGTFVESENEAYPEAERPRPGVPALFLAPRG